jgi:undecaprenyl-diphosphatase
MTGRPLFTAFLVWLAAGAGFAVFAAFAGAHDRFPGDLWLAQRFQEVETDIVARPLDWTRRLIEEPYWQYVAVTAAVVAVLLAGLRVVPVILLAGATHFIGLNPAMKELVERPRPSPDLLEVPRAAAGYSFPSGHAYNALLLYGLILVLVTLYVRDRRLRLPLQVFGVWTILACGLQRVYTGVHWPSDVIAGYWLGGLVLAVLLVLGLFVTGRLRGVSYGKAARPQRSPVRDAPRPQ